MTRIAIVICVSSSIAVIGGCQQKPTSTLGNISAKSEANGSEASAGSPGYSSHLNAAQVQAPPVDSSISMALVEHYANNAYSYKCHPTLESQNRFKLLHFGGNANIPGPEKSIPPPTLTIKLPDPPSAWYCVQNNYGK
jgi:hypothetical protein